MYRMTTGAYHIAEIKLSYQNVAGLSDRPKITQSKQAYAMFLQSWDMEKIGFVEQAKVLLMNQNNRVLGVYDHSSGGVTGTVCDPKLIFAAALKANACNLILAHNHPSENVAPSRADKDLTYKIKEAGKMLDIEVFDHLVISPHAYYSFSDQTTYLRKELGLDMDKKDAAAMLVAEERHTASLTSQSVIGTSLQKDIVARALIRSQLAYDAMLASWEQNTLDIQHGFKMFSLDKDCRITRLHSFPQHTKLCRPDDAAHVVSLAAKDNASFLVLAQNKPYGILLPKIADLDFAEMVNAAGYEHDLVLLDYLFVNKNGYYSYNDNEFHLAARMQPG